MDARVQQSEFKSDPDLIESILEQMKRNELSDARRPVPPEGHIEDLETRVRREIDCLLERAKRDDKDVIAFLYQKKTIDAGIQRAIGYATKALAIPVLPPLTRQGFELALRALRGMRWTPTSRQNGVGYKCAYEAYLLVEMWTAKKPTTYWNGPFLKITAIIFEYVGHKGDPKRACANVLKDHKRYG